MIETLARKRTNAVALAVLAGLVAAMFVALQSVSAANCVANPDITLAFNENCDIDVAMLNEDATGLAEVVPTGGAAGLTIAATTSTEDADTNINILALTAPGTYTVNLTAPDGTNTPDDDDADLDVVGSIRVTVVGFGIAKVEVVGDTDNVVSAGAPVMVRATIRSAAADAQVRLTVPTTGLSISTGTVDAPATSQVQEQDVPDSSADTPLGVVNFTVNTAGAPAGEYTLTFTADNNGDFADAADTDAEADKRDTQTLTLSIGEPGTGLASATLSLGESKPDLPFTDANEAVAETGSDVAKATGDADGKINLVIEVFDSLGGKANSSAINQIIVIAPKGTISTSHLTGDGTNTAGGNSSATLNQQDAETTDAVDPGVVGQKTVISVSKTDNKPGTVTVYAIVSGPGGAARTEDVTLTFSGPAASMTIADATESLLSVNPVDDPSTTGVDEAEEDTIKLQVTAEDSAGNNAPPPISGVSIVITDPDGKRKGSSVIGYTQPILDKGKYYITLTGKGTAASPLAAGNWTLRATSGKLEAEAMFAVAGAPADVMVSASATSSDTIGDVITVTARVTDKDGNTVSNGTMVMFSASANTGLAKIGTGHSGKATKNGEASVKYAVVGAGHSVVSATAGDATGVVVIDSTAGTADAAPEEVSLDCLSSNQGFATYTCSMASSASELFALVSGRGATAIQLWNGSMWVRYSVIDGDEIPGSSDFMVTTNDILYISN
jgi:hypothetical protein